MANPESARLSSWVSHGVCTSTAQSSHSNEGCRAVSWENVLGGTSDSMLSNFKLTSFVCWEMFHYCQVLDTLTFRGMSHLLKSQALGMTCRPPGRASVCVLSAHVLPLANSVTLSSHILCCCKVLHRLQPGDSSKGKSENNCRGHLVYFPFDWAQAWVDWTLKSEGVLRCTC